MPLTDWLPTPPDQGPPLPIILAPYLPFDGYWPWYTPAPGQQRTPIDIVWMQVSEGTLKRERTK